MTDKTHNFETPTNFNIFKHFVCVDAVIESSAGIVLIKRKNPPFQRMWALPGGRLDENESCEAAMFREVKEETSIPNICLDYVKLVGVYSRPGRDPRGGITIAYYATISAQVAEKHLKAADDAIEIGIFKEWDKMNLAFDHKEIIRDATNTFRHV